MQPKKSQGGGSLIRFSEGNTRKKHFEEGCCVTGDCTEDKYEIEQIDSDTKWEGFDEDKNYR